MSECMCNSESKKPDSMAAPGLQLAIASIPIQPWVTPYEPAKALKQGTIFSNLDLPFFLTGGGSNDGV